MKKLNWHKEQIKLENEIEGNPVPIVKVAGVANPYLAEGKLLPYVIIDTSSRPDVEDMILAHTQYSPGDVDSVWGKEGEELIDLWLWFKQPSRCILRLQFHSLKDGLIINQIIAAEAIYLQSSKEGINIPEGIDKNRIIIEIPSKSFSNEWNKLLKKAIEKDARKKGMSRAESRQHSKQVIDNFNKLGKKRIK